ncbi:MAG: carboxypeptidase-like regulatory domain-containing protein [Candidatus Bathyarchaeia archaeon]
MTARLRCVTSPLLYAILLALLASPIISFPAAHATADKVAVSPGGHDQLLGKGFPTEDVVKLEYPKSTVLTASLGELLFNVTLTTFNYTSGARQKSIVKSLSIYIPPEFVINNGLESVWTSFTNDYSTILLSNVPSYDPIAPGWSVLKVSSLNITRDVEDVQSRAFVENRTQYVRVFNVTSPSVAGRYFFKVFITIGGLTYSIGSHNFPTLVVKASLNPAYISGVVRYGGSAHASLYGEPLDSTAHPDGTVLLPKGYGGRVYAEGLTAEGERVQAQAYFNATAGGRYTLYGLAAATYNITVQAAGYPPQRFLEAATVAQGQSLEDVDFYLTEGVNITGKLYSKHGTGEIPWGYSYNTALQMARRIVTVDITDLEERVVASSPLRLYEKSLLIFRPRDTLDPNSAHCYFSLMREVSFDGHIPQDYANYTSGIAPGDYYVKAHVAGYVQLEPTVVHARNSTREVEAAIDLQRTGLFNVTVHFKHRQEDLTPSPTQVGGYLYLEILDETGRVAGFNISYVPAGTASFTMEICGIDIWNRLMIGGVAHTYARDSGLLPGTYVINALFMNRTVEFIAVNALILPTPEMRKIYPVTNGPLVSYYTSQALEATNRETPLYFQLEMVKASTGGFCGSITWLSIPLVKGGGLNLTIRPIDWQKPPINREWAHPGSGIRIDIYNARGDLIDTIRAVQPATGRSLTVSTIGEIIWEDGTKMFGRALGLKSGTYLLKIYAPGYLQDSERSPAAIPVTLGAVSDTRINLLRGAAIDLTVVFRTEHLLDPVDNKLLYARPINNIDATPVRVEVFDELGEFVAGNITYAERGSSSIRVLLDGFNGYYGNPRMLWTNFYDTTDGVIQDDSGLDEGSYTIRLTIAGYRQIELFQVRIDSGATRSRPTVSAVTSVDRLGYLYGTVTWVDWCGRANPLSWASITAYDGGGVEECYAYSADGFYEMWLVPGTYDFGLYHPGFEVKYLRYELYIGWGSSSSLNFLMN